MKPYDKEDDLSDAGQDLVPKQNTSLALKGGVAFQIKICRLMMLMTLQAKFKSRD